jgi:hypothetical protein
MEINRLTAYLKIHLKRYGTIYMLKESIRFLACNIFKIRRLLIYENSLNNIPLPDSLKPNIENLELYFITSIKELEDLISKGYDFSFYTNIDYDKEMLTQNIVLLAVFLRKDMAFKSWVAIDNQKPKPIAKFLNYISNKNPAIQEASATNPKYRRKGIFKFAHASACFYAKQFGKEYIQSSVAVNNRITRKTLESLGDRIVYSGYFFQVMYLWYFYHFRLVRMR